MFSNAKIKFTKGKAIIEIPESIAKKLYPKQEKEADIFLTVTNGILQGSAKSPDTFIPLTEVTEEDFVKQKD